MNPPCFSQIKVASQATSTELIGAGFTVSVNPEEVTAEAETVADTGEFIVAWTFGIPGNGRGKTTAADAEVSVWTRA